VRLGWVLGRVPHLSRDCGKKVSKQVSKSISKAQISSYDAMWSVEPQQKCFQLYELSVAIPAESGISVG